MTATVTFACGHQAQLTGAEENPACGCGERKIVAVKAPPPKFRGHCTGPCSKFESLPARAVNLGVTKESVNE